jgi:hypothetical protein
MDEFDVFMDAINRRIATQTLLEFAREKGDLQFIFLTPQVCTRTHSPSSSSSSSSNCRHAGCFAHVSDGLAVQAVVSELLRRLVVLAGGCAAVC